MYLLVLSTPNSNANPLVWREEFDHPSPAINGWGDSKNLGRSNSSDHLSMASFLWRRRGREGGKISLVLSTESSLERTCKLNTHEGSQSRPLQIWGFSMRLFSSILKSQIQKGQFGSLLLFAKNKEFFPCVYLGRLCGKRLQRTFQIMQGTSLYSVFLS
jgi:hypothetical protein